MTQLRLWAECPHCLRQVPIKAFSTNIANELTENTKFTEDVFLCPRNYWSSSLYSHYLLKISRDGKWILVSVHQQHRKQSQGKNVAEAVRMRNKGSVIAVSAGKEKKWFSNRPLTIIKVEHEATARGKTVKLSLICDTRAASWLVEGSWW